MRNKGRSSAAFSILILCSKVIGASFIISNLNLRYDHILLTGLEILFQPVLIRDKVS